MNYLKTNWYWNIDNNKKLSHTNFKTKNKFIFKKVYS